MIQFDQRSVLLGVTGRDSEPLGLAAVLSPTRAVTDAAVVAGEHDIYLLTASAVDRPWPARVEAVDDTIGFAVLQFGPLPTEFSPVPMLLDEPAPDQPCEYYTDATEEWDASTAVERRSVDPTEVIRTAGRIGRAFSDLAWIGSPVFVDGRLAGIVTGRKEMLSLHAMRASKVVDLGFAGEAPVAKDGDDDALFASLSPSSKKALAFAAGIAGGDGKVHMEHLIRGLYDKNPGPTRSLFDRAGMTDQELGALIASVVGTGVPETADVRVLHRLPALSKHVREAIEIAATKARDEGAERVQSRYLLFGALSVSRCTLIQELQKFSPILRPEEVGLGRSSDGATAPNTDQTKEPEVEGEENSIQISSICDSPAQYDALGFTPYVEAIARFLRSPQTRPPLTLSIEGEWGSGKSSFMLQLSRSLAGAPVWKRLRAAWTGTAEKGAPPRTRRLWNALLERQPLQVQFNPWRHDGEESLWAAFALEFLRQVKRQRSFPRRWWGNLHLFMYHATWKGWVALSRALVTWVVLLFVTFVVPAVVFFERPHWSQEVLKKLSESEPKGGAEGKHESEPKGSGEGKREKPDALINSLIVLGGNAAYFALVLSIWIKVKELIDNPLEIDLKKYLRSPDYGERVAFVERFHEDFKHVVAAYADKRKVFIFVDDLDRCEVPKAADLIKAVNLLISDDPRLIFILGMDREKVIAGLAVKYERLLPYVAQELPPEGEKADAGWKRRAGLEFGHYFLQKFVQLPFRVPSPNPEHYETYFRNISPARRDDSHRQGAPALSADHNPPPTLPRSETSVTGATTSPASGGQTEGSPSLSAETGGSRSSPPPTADQIQERRRRELQFDGDSDLVRELLKMVASALDRNPRWLKQFVNLFRLQAYIANDLGFFDEPDGARPHITFEQLGKFVALGLKWPALLADFAANRDLLAELQRCATGAPAKSANTAKPAAATHWATVKKLREFLSYGMTGEQSARYTMENPAIYELLQISPQRPKVSPPPPTLRRAAGA